MLITCSCDSYKVKIIVWSQFFLLIFIKNEIRTKQFDNIHPPNKRQKQGIAEFFNNNEEEVSIDEEDVVEVHSETTLVSGKYGNDFVFFYKDDVKYGRCNECGKKKVVVEIKMQKGNTKGIINHLKKDHPALYRKKYALMNLPKNKDNNFAMTGKSKFTIIWKVLEPRVVLTFWIGGKPMKGLIHILPGRLETFYQSCLRRSRQSGFFPMDLLQ